VAQTFNYQGQFYNEAGSAVLLDTVNLTLEILDPTGTCLLYSEQQNGIDLSTTNGLFAVQVGSLTTGPEAAKRTVAPAPVANRDPVPSLSMATIFSNLVPIFAPGSTNCVAGYDPSSAGHAGDGRLLRVIVDDVTTSTTVTLSPDLPIGSAGQTVSSQTLQGIGPTGFIQVDSTATQVNIDLLTHGPTTDASSLHNHDSLYVKLSSTTGQSLGSGVTFTTAGQIGIGTSTPGGNLEIDAESATAIAEIIKPHAGQTGDLLDVYNLGGTVETKINAAGDLVLNGSPAASQSYVSTNFLPLAGGALTGPVTSTSTITFLNGAKAVGFAPPTTAPANNVTWALPAADGVASTFLQTDGAGHLTWAAASGGGGITSLDGLSGATQTFATTEAATSVAPVFTAATTVHTLNIPLASAAGTTAGLIANTDYANFTAKVNRTGDTMTGPLVINTATTPDALAQETISTHAVGNKGLVVQGIAGQTGDLFESQLSSGTRETYIDQNGNLFLNVDPTSNMQAATQEFVTTAISTAGGTYLPLAGGALTGPVTQAASTFIQSGNSSATLGTGSGSVILSSGTGTTAIGNTTGTISMTGGTTLTSTTSPQLSVNYDGTDKTTIGVASDGFTTITTAGTAPGFNFTGGNVGIGTTSPGAQLETDISADAGIGTIIKSHSASQAGDLLEVQNSTGVKQIWVDSSYNINSAGFYINLGNSGGAGAYRFGPNGVGGSTGMAGQGTNASTDFLDFTTMFASRLHITGAGNVGIRTAAPQSALDVASDGSSANSGTISIGAGPFDGTTAGFFGTSSSSNTNGTELAINAVSGYTGDLANFEVGGVSKFRIDASGNVTEAGTVTNTGTVNDTGAVNINTTGSGATNIGTGSSSGAVTIGNSSDSVALGAPVTQAGSSITQTGSSSVTLGTGTGTTTLGTGSGAVNIGASTAAATAINIGTGTSTGIVTIGNATGGTRIIANLGVGAAPVAGTTANISSVAQSGTNAYGLAVNAPTGATNNYAAEFLGGKVGIGNSAPTATLDVAGQLHAQVFANGLSTAIDWNNGNVQTTSAVCTGTATQFTFANMLEGGSYTLIVTGTATGTCNFTTSGGTVVTPAGLTGWSFTPANAIPPSGAAVYTMLRAGNVVYVSWIDGFPTPN
jgi:trimeric autotransporter adhesin